MPSERVMVFVGYENMHRCAGHEFGIDSGHFWPHLLGQCLIERRNTNLDRESHFASVRVYRGLPVARLQPEANVANQAQAAAWRSVCPNGTDLTLTCRPLRYPDDFPKRRGQEKGIDVALAVDLEQFTYQSAYDVAIACSHDSDLAPALDVVRLVSTVAHHLEIASWDTYRRISYSGDADKPRCHRLKRDDFDRAVDATRDAGLTERETGRT